MCWGGSDREAQTASRRTRTHGRLFHQQRRFPRSALPTILAWQKRAKCHECPHLYMHAASLNGIGPMYVQIGTVLVSTTYPAKAAMKWNSSRNKKFQSVNYRRRMGGWGLRWTFAQLGMGFSTCRGLTHVEATLATSSMPQRDPNVLTEGTFVFSVSGHELPLGLPHGRD